jgi:4-hydroxybenzoate polyprenyltransferase
MVKNKHMKIALAGSLGVGFILSYFLNITMNNAEQYIAVVGVILLDGGFGMLSGVKREGFKTYKAIRIIKATITWVLMLTAILMVEKGFPGTSWLSETIIAPFIVFQIISALKNASMAGYVSNDLLNIILDKLDKHKGIR